MSGISDASGQSNSNNTDIISNSKQHLWNSFHELCTGLDTSGTLISPASPTSLCSGRSSSSICIFVAEEIFSGTVFAVVLLSGSTLTDKLLVYKYPSSFVRHMGCFRDVSLNHISNIS